MCATGSRSLTQFLDHIMIIETGKEAGILSKIVENEY
jgi:hypothetical protein